MNKSLFKGSYGDWIGEASSSTGKYVIIYSLNKLLVSSDYGVTFIIPNNLPNVYWSKVACDTTGNYMVATNDTNVCKSSNFGIDWESTVAFKKVYIGIEA